MKYRTLGRTGLKVSEIGFGAWAIGGPSTLGPMQIGWGKTDDDESVRAMEAAFEAGVNFFDTADVYGNGHSEALIGRTFGGPRREKVVLATKFGNLTLPDGSWVKDFRPEVATRCLEASLQRLGTDYVDVYQIHSPRPDFDIATLEDTFATLERLKQAGKVRSYGTSIFASAHGIELIRRGWGDLLQVRFNALETEPAEELLPLAAAENVGIIVRVPLASGFLTGKFNKGVQFGPDDHRSRTYPPERRDAIVDKVDRLRFLVEGKQRTMAQAALQFVLSFDGVSTVIPGAKTAAQARDNANAAGATLTDEEMARARQITAD
jgi:aryl-alcohol dehydrogenase-like predicted oxidoreductase